MDCKTLSLIVAAVALGACNKGDTPIGEFDTETNSGTVSGGPGTNGPGSGTESTSTTMPPLDDGGTTCPGCIAGFGVQVVTADGMNISGSIEMSYTKDGVPSMRTTEQLCNDSGCSIGEEDGQLEITVEYGDCAQTEMVTGWLSCGCSLAQAPWDPLTFTFATSCAPGTSSSGDSTGGSDSSTGA